MAEDAYIPFRVIDNFLSGYGLRWNIDERVQVFTDPLFLLMQIAATALFGHLYVTTLVLSCLLTLGAFLLITNGADAPAIALALVALVSSKGFMDYSMSGIENPATHLAIAAYLYFYWRKPDPLILSLIAALAATNRMDTVLFFVPSLARVYFRAGWKVWKPALIGWSPFLMWSLFSLFYYGFLFPNTAYAKLNTAVPARDLIWQGLLYYVDAWRYDTATLIVIGAGLFLACYKRRWTLAAGILLNLIYVARVGGDYMISRFFTGAVVFSVAILARDWTFRPALTAALAGLIAGVGLTIPSPALSSAHSGFSAPWPLDYNLHVVDERAWGYPCSGFLRYLDRSKAQPVTHLARPDNAWWMSCSGPTFFDRTQKVFPDAALARVGLEFKRRGAVEVWGNIGMAGYFAGPRVHIVDPLALGDSLIARLPMVPGIWAPGNYLRHVPEGYVETIRTGVNQIRDPKIAEYYDHLRIVVSGDLWSWNRLKEIYRFNTGYYDHLLPKPQHDGEKGRRPLAGARGSEERG
jgi:arabinofuranosyltransferase